MFFHKLEKYSPHICSYSFAVGAGVEAYIFIISAFRFGLVIVLGIGRFISRFIKYSAIRCFIFSFGLIKHVGVAGISG